MKEIEREGNRNAKRLLSRRRCTQSKTQHSFNTTTFFLASIQLLVIRDCCGVQSFRVSLPIFLLSYFMWMGKCAYVNLLSKMHGDCIYIAGRFWFVRSLSHFSQLYCWTHLIYFLHQTDTENGVHIVLRPGLHFISQTNNNNHGISPIPKFWTVDCVFVDKFLLNAVRFQHWQNVHHFNCSLQYSHEWFCLMKTVTHIPILQIHIRIDTQPVISSVVSIS